MKNIIYRIRDLSIELLEIYLNTNIQIDAQKSTKQIRKKNTHRCIDYYKPVASGYPLKLYHTTIDKKGVCQNGLKSSNEISNTGLGGIKEDFISFTIEKRIAFNIAKDLRTLIRIANEEITIENMGKYLDRVDNVGRFTTKSTYKKKYGQSHIQVPTTFSAEGQNILTLEDKAYLYLQKGDKYYIHLKKKPSQIWNEILKRAKKREEFWLKKDKTKGLYLIWTKYYLPKREEYGGRRDPYFATSNDPNNLKDKNVQDIGVFKVQAFLPKRNIYFKDSSRFRTIKDDWVDNDFELKEYLREGEYITREVKIPRERFTKLEEINISKEIKIPSNVIEVFPSMNKKKQSGKAFIIQEEKPKEVILGTEKVLNTFYNIKDYSEIDYCVLECHNYTYCEKVLKLLNRICIPSTEYIYLGTLEKIKEKWYNNEMVFYRLFEQDNIAMNLNRNAFPYAPRTIIVPIDHPKYDNLMTTELVFEEIMTSIFHESAHLNGITNEEKAEAFAQKRIKKMT